MLPICPLASRCYTLGGGGLTGGGGVAGASETIAPGGGGNGPLADMVVVPGIGGIPNGTPGGTLIGGGGGVKEGLAGLLGNEEVGVGFGDTGAGLVAASRAFILASLSSLPANIIPDRIPVKNVEIGISISKNFWSIGDIALRGCVTNIIEYNTTNTIPVSVSVKHTPIKNLRRAIN